MYVCMFCTHQCITCILYIYKMYFYVLFLVCCIYTYIYSLLQGTGSLHTYLSFLHSLHTMVISCTHSHTQYCFCHSFDKLLNRIFRRSHRESLHSVLFFVAHVQDDWIMMAHISTAQTLQSVHLVNIEVYIANRYMLEKNLCKHSWSDIKMKTRL